MQTRPANASGTRAQERAAYAGSGFYPGLSAAFTHGRICSIRKYNRREFTGNALREPEGSWRPTQITYSDLAEFGLPFITPESAEFQTMADQILDRPSPFGRAAAGDVRAAAIVVNGSGKTVLSLTALCIATDAGGASTTGYFSGLSSSPAINAIMGEPLPGPRHGSVILPGSKRLITRTGMWGDNTDVFPADERSGGSGMAGGWSGRPLGEPVSVELILDLAIFEDGLCAGPDRCGTFESFLEQLAERRALAIQAAELLRSGAPRGQIFDLLRPSASFNERRREPNRSMTTNFVSVSRDFAMSTIHQLVNSDHAMLLASFERASRPPAIELRRP